MMRASVPPVLLAFVVGLATPAAASGLGSAARGGQAATAGGQTAAPGSKAGPSTAEFESLRASAEEARVSGRTEEAVALYARAVALQPTWTEGHWYLGTIYYDTDRHRECRDAFARVVAQEPEHGAAWAFRGLCEFRLGEYANALEHLTKAKQLGVGDEADFVAVTAYHRGILLARFEQFERAFEVHAAFVRGGNTSPEILQALGIAVLRLPMLPSEVPAEKRDMVDLAGHAAAYTLAMMKEEADKAYARLLSTYGDEPNVHFMYGTYLARERPSEAIEQYKAELIRSPRHALARIQIAQELIKLGDFAAAAPYAREGAQLAPNDFLARKVLGEVKLQAGDAAGAVAELETARRLEPSSPSVRFQLARAYQRAGRADDAKRERAEFSRLEAIQQKQRGAATGDEEPKDATPPQ